MCGRGESRHPEWDLMYRKGLTVGRIAILCGAVRETVGRHLRVQRAKFPDMQAEHEACRPEPKPTPLRPSWLANIKELSALVEAGVRYPTSSDPDPERRRLGYWLSAQRRAQRDGRLSQAKLAALTALPKWNENQRLELAQKRWQERLAELQAFKTLHGRWPRFRNPGSEAERIVGVWLHGQRTKALNGQLVKADLRALDKIVPGWNTWRRKRPRENTHQTEAAKFL
jgi:hypothetical protein